MLFCIDDFTLRYYSLPGQLGHRGDFVALSLLRAFSHLFVAINGAGFSRVHL